MTEPQTITLYTDYKSPYAYLAKDLAYGLADEFSVRLHWQPYILDIPSFLGSARLDAGGRVIDEAPRPGSRGTTVAFIHPKTSFGTLIELVQE